MGLPVFAFLTQFLYLSLSNILIWTSTHGSARYKRNIQNRKIQSKRVLGLMKYTHRLADHNKVDNPIRIQKVFSFWELFPATTKNWHNRTTVLYTKYVCNTKNYFPPKPKKEENSDWTRKFCTKLTFPPQQKNDTTNQLYCTLSMYVTPKTISRQNQKS